MTEDHTKAFWHVMAVALVAALALPATGAGVAVQPTSARAEERSEAFLQRGDLLGSLSLSSGRGPVEIMAKTLQFDYRKLELTYQGDVRVKQGDLTLKADRLRVLLDDRAKDPVREVTAEGKVRIAQGERVATGGRAVFDQKSRTVTLSDGAVLRQGLNEVSGERVVGYLDEERWIVEGGGAPVRARLFPPNDGSTEKDLDQPSGVEDGARRR